MKTEETATNELTLGRAMADYHLAHSQFYAASHAQQPGQSADDIETAYEAFRASFKRAIELPARNLGDLKAKLRLYLSHEMEFLDPEHTKFLVDLMADVDGISDQANAVRREAYVSPSELQ